MRLVSLVPSLTKTICDLGLRDKLVGCTNFCVDPPGLHRAVQLVGGTKDADLAAVADQRPTHILVNDEENTPEIIARCHEIAPTIVTAPVHPRDSIQLLRDLGDRLECGLKAEAIAQQIDDKLKEVYRLRETRGSDQKFIYLIWRDPYMAAGPETYLSRAVELLGWKNALSGEQRYPALEGQQLEQLNADVTLFTSEPYPFRKRHIAEYRTSVSARGKAYKADGQLFTWWGSMTNDLLSEVILYLQGQPTSLIKRID